METSAPAEGSPKQEVNAMRIRFLMAALLAASFLMTGCVSDGYARVHAREDWRRPPRHRDHDHDRDHNGYR